MAGLETELPTLDELKGLLDAYRNADGLLDLAKVPQDLPQEALEFARLLDVNGDGLLDAEEEKTLTDFAAQFLRGGKRKEGRGKGAQEPEPLFPEELLAALHADDAVSVCDEIATLRMFVYSPGMPASILQDADAVGEGSKPTLKRSLDLSDEELEAVGEAPPGIDPELHRKAFGAYRATMGTPMGLGSTFQSTTALESPYEIEEGRWFNAPTQDGSVPYEAVMTTKGNEQFRAKAGDSILLIDRASLIGVTREYQLQVVGIVNDTETDGFYISRALAQVISKNAPVQTSALYLKISGDVEAFRERWQTPLALAAPEVVAVTPAEIAEQKIQAIKENQSFKTQAASGALFAALAALLIVFTALNMSVDEQKRLIAFYRVSGLSRSQVGLSILLEAILLALPGWIVGMATGWLLVLIYTHKPTGLNMQTITFSFVCTFLGAVVAALYPIFVSARVKPLDAIKEPEKSFPSGKRRRRQTILFLIAAALGLLAIGGNLYLVHSLQGKTAHNAALHTCYALMLLAGVVLTLPITIRLAEYIALPILARLFLFDPRIMRNELSGNTRRVSAVAVALSVGGGLFVSLQIWGYSLLDQFLPERYAPEAFAAFLPTGLRPEMVDEMKKLPMIDESQFLPIAVEQAAFTDDAEFDDPRKKAFANVVFWARRREGVRRGRAFRKITVPTRGSEKAWREVKSGAARSLPTRCPSIIS